MDQVIPNTMVRAMNQDTERNASHDRWVPSDPADRPVRLVIARTDSEVDELVADRCWVNHVMGIEERDDLVVATFERRVDAEAARHEIEALFDRGSIAGRIVTEEVIDTGWLDAWRAHAETTRVGDLTIRPPWLDRSPDAGGELEILIDPGHAFGSGSHESTRLALRAIGHVVETMPDRSEQRMLDVGCGSGVLAIAAVLLGFGQAVAIDIDPAAVTATDANAARNDVTGRIEASTRPLDDVGGSFDLVVANVLAPVLRELGNGLATHLSSRGRLVISGLLTDQRSDVVSHLPGLAVEQLFEEGDWTAAVLTAP